MVIEIVGVPGGGKTHIARRLADHLGCRVVDLGYAGGLEADGQPSTARRKVLGWLAGMARNPWLAVQLLLLARAADAPYRYALEILRRKWIVRNLCGADEASVIVDEGPLHRLAWLMGRAGRATGRWTSRVSSAHAVIVLEASPQDALERIRLRNCDHELLDTQPETALVLLHRYQQALGGMLNGAALLAVHGCTTEELLAGLTRAGVIGDTAR